MFLVLYFVCILYMYVMQGKVATHLKWRQIQTISYPSRWEKKKRRKERKNKWKMKIKTTSCLYEKNHVHDIFFNNEINNIERNKTSGKVKKICKRDTIEYAYSTLDL